MQFREPTEGEQLLYNRIITLEDAYNAERDRADAEAQEAERLRADYNERIAIATETVKLLEETGKAVEAAFQEEVDRLSDTLMKLMLEAIHYRDTGVGVEHLSAAIERARLLFVARAGVGGVSTGEISR